MFFPETRKTISQEIRASFPALKICARCPVVAECLEEAFEDEHSFSWGVWGGSTPRQRQAVVDRPDRVEILLAELRRQTARGVA